MQSQDIETHTITRVRIWYALMILLFGVFALRLFYIQVIRYDHYKQVAMSDQVHEYEVVPTRGAIYATTSEGGSVPLVVNQRLFTLYADPTVVKDVDTVARNLAPIVGGSEQELRDLMSNKKRRYVVLAKRLSKEQSAKVLKFAYAGVGTQEKNYRIYPQGALASQTLGFVNDDGEGKYGLEQALNSTLGGTRGWLKAVTDVNGVPLAANEDNLSRKPVPGKDVKLTIDIGMQTQLEDILQRAQAKFRSKLISGVILETQTGAVKAMANYPTYDPAAYQTVQDGTLFQNGVVSNAIEPGSITKVFTTATALDRGVINANSTYNDPGIWQIDGAKILNVAEGKGSGPQSIKSLLNLSLNTGATWELMQLGGGKLNLEGRSVLYDYFVNKYRLSKVTGVEQGYESTGYVPEAEDNGAGINLTFANMSFGQAYSATAMQMGAALGAIVNGGTYYQPTLVQEIQSQDGKNQKMAPKVVAKNVVSPQVSNDMIGLLDYVTKAHVNSFKYMNFGDKYIVGGKTGTAQIADNKTRLYREDAFNGTFMGFVGGDKPQYTIVIYNIEPRGYAGYAGAQTGQPVFADVAHMLIDNYGVEPKTSP
jgi:cell division protein FtsI/penicillin-binding protein 2